MKVPFYVFLSFTIIVLGLFIYNAFFAYHGADGLSGFFEGIVLGGGCIICMIITISFGSIVFLPKASVLRRLGIVTCLSVIGITIFLLAFLV
ncbi:hypothetical protein SAMN04487910_1232 [Aquimarina amphilecti]|uniref:Uncharacterized protein n=1 Tax=Aquimarina amphilecti TaxID=1038014 RepID=A0A1H7K7N1_AQUAM|nr:hypothetical protein [Aquimarina amphilecti]SEK82829.1 hypothetical protein SAMN04487910_1232 [Aquimarina amphilecti]